MMRIALATTALLAANVSAPVIASTQQAQYHFFPSKPYHAALHVLTGTLIEYSIGNDEGGFGIVADGKKYEIYVSEQFRINGKPATCDKAPTPQDPPDSYCKWPSNIVVGKTTVTTAYWLQKKPEESGLVMVANEFHAAETRGKK